MTTSGRIGQVSLPLQEILDAAFRACRVVPQNVTPEMLVNGKKALQRMLNALPARAVPLWARDHQILPFTPGARAMALPAGTIDVVSAHARSYTLHAAEQSGSGSMLTFDMGATNRVTAFAFRPVATGPFALTVDASTDNLNWTNLLTAATESYSGTETRWFEAEPVVEARYVRLATVTGAQLDSFLIAGDFSDTEILRFNHNDYVSLTNSSTQGPKPYQFWLDRQADAPEMRLYPVPNGIDEGVVLSLWRQRHIEDVGSLTQTLEIPARWEESLIVALAYRIAIDTPQVDLSVISILKPLADEFTALIAADERDRSPINVRAGIRGYTR